jgi:hypothetical protein
LLVHLSLRNDKPFAAIGSIEDLLEVARDLMDVGLWQEASAPLSKVLQDSIAHQQRQAFDLLARCSDHSQFASAALAQAYMNGDGVTKGAPFLGQ